MKALIICFWIVKMCVCVCVFNFIIILLIKFICKEYAGDRNELKQRHGKGKALLPNGDYYEGHYSEGLRNGRGYYVFKGGGQYRGQYKEGLKSAHGTFFYPDGSKYEGEWKKDKKHGHGIYIYPNGDIYEGMWRNDFRDGLGTYIYKNCNVTVLGIWNNGKIQGPVQITYPDSTYFGTFQNNMPIGKGCFTFNSHCMLHGYYVHIQDDSADVEEVVLGLEEEDVRSTREGYPKGIIPIWRPQKITSYSGELLPPRPYEQQKPPSISSSVGLDFESMLVPEQEIEKKESIKSKTSGDKLANSDVKKSDENLELGTAEVERDNEGGIDVNGTETELTTNEPASDLQPDGDAEA